MSKVDDPKLWGRIRLGDEIVLTDEFTLEECVTAGEQSSPLLEKRYPVQRIESVLETSLGARWYLFLLDDDRALYLLVKTFGKRIAYYVVYKPEGLECGDRKFLCCEHDGVPGHWFFENNTGKETDFDVRALDFTPQFKNEVAIEGQGNVDLWYNKTDTYHGEGRDSELGNKISFGAVTEYSCEHDLCDQPFALIREVGEKSDLPRGGWVDFMLGREVFAGDLEVYQQ